MNRLILLSLVLSAAACNQADNLSISGDGVTGVWILSERGYSPGSGYIVEPVSETPPLTMTFSSEQQFSSNLAGMEEFKFYDIANDSNGHLTLTIFKSKPDPANPADPSRQSFLIEYETEKMKLIPVFPSICIEGCHQGFKRFRNTLD